MIIALNIVDEKWLSALTNDVDFRLERTNSLRSFFLYIISLKHFVDTNKEHQNDADNKHVIEH